MWVSIFTILWAIFGDRIREWFLSLFSKVAKELPAPESYGSEAEATLALLDRALEKVKRRPLKRLMLLFMRRNVVRDGKLVESLPPEAQDELKALQSVAKKSGDI